MTVNENIGKFFHSKEIFKHLFSCVATKCKIVFSLPCVKSKGKWITIPHTWLIFSLCVRLEWGGVYFDNGDLISLSQIHEGKQLETIFKEPVQLLSFFKDRRQ